MQNLKTHLKSSLKGASRIAVLGIGSELRADDIAGILVSQQLEALNSAAFRVFLGYTAPENLSGEIRKFNPTHLIMIDTAEIGKEPGQIAVFKPEDAGGISFSTHKLPIKLMADYLQKEIKCRVFIIGIQPKSIEFGNPVSAETQKAVKHLFDTLKQVIGDVLSGDVL